MPDVKVRLKMYCWIIEMKVAARAERLSNQESNIQSQWMAGLNHKDTMSNKLESE